MNKESFKNSVDNSRSNYSEFLELGGIINEKDYQNTLERAKDPNVLYRKDRFEAQQVKNPIKQVKSIAEFSGIELSDSENNLDSKVVLYVILRLDVRPEKVGHHHSQMSDQQLFGEVLRILGDVDSLDTLMKAYPNISFKYEK